MHTILNRPVFHTTSLMSENLVACCCMTFPLRCYKDRWRMCGDRYQGKGWLQIQGCIGAESSESIYHRGCACRPRTVLCDDIDHSEDYT